MSKNSLKSGAILSYITLIVGNVVAIICTPITLRMLGASEYGLTALANSVIGYLSILNLGLGTSMIRYLTKYRAEGNKEKEARLNGAFLIMYLVLATIVLILGIALIFNSDKIFSDKLTGGELYKIKILMIITLANLVISFPTGIFNSIMYSYERFFVSNLVGLIRSIISPLCTVAILFMGYKSIGTTLVATLINIAVIIFNIIYCFKVLKIKIKFKKIEGELLREIWIYSSFIFINIIVDKIYWTTDQFILGATAGTVAVTIYSIGSTFNAYYMTFSTSMSGLFLPRITTMITKKASDKELTDIFIRIGRIQYLILSFVLGGFMLVGKSFIYFWAGEGFEESFYIALLVMIPLTVPLIQNIGISILQAKNMHKFRSGVYLVIAILNVFATINLSKIYGGIGAALATSISFTLGNIVIMNIYYYKKINIDIPKFWREILKISKGFLLSLFIGFLISKIFNEISIINMVLIGGIYSIAFITLAYKMSMNEYEKGIFTSITRKFIRKKEVSKK